MIIVAVPTSEVGTQKKPRESGVGNQVDGALVGRRWRCNGKDRNEGVVGATVVRKVVIRFFIAFKGAERCDFTGFIDMNCHEVRVTFDQRPISAIGCLEWPVHDRTDTWSAQLIACGVHLVAENVKGIQRGIRCAFEHDRAIAQLFVLSWRVRVQTDDCWIFSTMHVGLKKLSCRV